MTEERLVVELDVPLEGFDSGNRDAYIAAVGAAYAAFREALGTDASRVVLPQTPPQTSVFQVRADGGMNARLSALAGIRSVEIAPRVAMNHGQPALVAAVRRRLQAAPDLGELEGKLLSDWARRITEQVLSIDEKEHRDYLEGKVRCAETYLDPLPERDTERQHSFEETRLLHLTGDHEGVLRRTKDSSVQREQFYRGWSLHKLNRLDECEATLKEARSNERHGKRRRGTLSFFYTLSALNAMAQEVFGRGPRTAMTHVESANDHKVRPLCPFRDATSALVYAFSQSYHEPDQEALARFRDRAVEASEDAVAGALLQAVRPGAALPERYFLSYAMDIAGYLYYRIARSALSERRRPTLELETSQMYLKRALHHDPTNCWALFHSGLLKSKCLGDLHGGIQLLSAAKDQAQDRGELLLVRLCIKEVDRVRNFSPLPIQKAVAKTMGKSRPTLTLSVSAGIEPSDSVWPAARPQLRPR